jgi:hypothetical protein
MGTRIFDQYSLLHFSSGIIAYFFNISFILWNVIHILFEYLENTPSGMSFITKYLLFWPGGKPGSDTIINNIGDIIAGIIGWLTSYLFDYMGTKYSWYQPHLIKQ